MKRIYFARNLLLTLVLCGCASSKRGYISCESVEVKNSESDKGYIYRVEQKVQHVDVRKWTNSKGECFYGEVFTSKYIGSHPDTFYIYDIDEGEYFEDGDHVYKSWDIYGVIQETTKVYFDVTNNVILQEKTYSEYKGSYGDSEKNKETWKAVKKNGVYFFHIDNDAGALVTYGTSGAAYLFHRSYYNNSLVKNYYMQFGDDVYIKYVER